MNKAFNPETVVPILADAVVSISDLKRNPAAVIAAARGQQVAILSRNKPVAYVISPEVWEHVTEVFADRKLERDAMQALEEDDGEYVTINFDEYL